MLCCQSLTNKNYKLVQQIMDTFTSSGISSGSLQQNFAHCTLAHSNTGKDLYPALPGATHSPPWLDHHLRELQEKAMAERPTYSAVEKRAVYSQKGVINTSFEMMGSNELHVPLHPSNLYTFGS